MDIKVIVATHKAYSMPRGGGYLPLHVGREGKADLGYTGDNTGENISEKNATYCELTGLYWAWKNLPAEYLGLAHYRRHFSGKSLFYRMKHGKKASILRKKEMEKILETTDVILPYKRHYVIETVYEHYCHTHYPEPLDETRKILDEYYPQMVYSFDRVMKRRSVHMFNMYIMKREYSDEYCEFLFDVLEKLEPRIDISDYSDFQKRVYGRISEMLLDTWIVYKGLKYKEVPVMHMEPVNWIKKGFKMLYSKFAHQYY